MKIIRTANLGILKIWLIGGQVNASGNTADAFNTFTDYVDDLKNESGKFDKILIKKAVENLILNCGNAPSTSDHQSFNYYDDNYRFKLPGEKNLNILVKRIKNELSRNDATA